MFAEPERNANEAWVRIWNRLREGDQRLIAEIMADRLVVGRMHLAWSMTLRDGLERSFWIYRPGPGRLAVGKLWKGTSTATDPNQFYERLYLRPSPDAAVANYHTHPGTHWRAEYPSWSDDRFGQGSNTLSILQTRFGFTFGRLTHYERRRAK